MKPSPATLSAAARGDRTACQQLLADCGPVVWALCRRLAVDPDDAYQDVWVHVFERLDRFDPEGPAAFTTWLHKVAHNKLLDRHRRRARGAQIFVVEEPPELPSRAPSAARQLVARDTLERGLASLDPAQRRTLLLHHVAGQSLADIAETEGVALGTVKSRLHRARVALSRALEAP